GALARAQELKRERGLIFIPAFDDEDVVSGQGTLGLEILEDLPDAGLLIIPVGGGGLSAGIATAVKALRPQVRIIGVQAAAAHSAFDSYRSDHVVPSPPKP